MNKKNGTEEKAMRSGGSLGRTDAVAAKISAPRREVVALPRTQDETVKEIVQAEMPLCKTRFDTGCCVFIIAIITGCGIGIGLWYVHA